MGSLLDSSRPHPRETAALTFLDANTAAALHSLPARVSTSPVFVLFVFLSSRPPFTVATHTSAPPFSLWLNPLSPNKFAH
eukprot:321718-Pleurochrysis_carterae.AAC.1